MNPAQPRRAEIGDAHAVRALTRAAYAKWVVIIGREPLPMVADQTIAIRDNIVVVWELDNTLVAAVELFVKADYLLIENIAVQPGYQGMGLGKRALCHAEDIARKHALLEIRLYTNARFLSNITWYKRHGYEEYRREEMVPGSETVHMRKPLPDIH